MSVIVSFIIALVIGSEDIITTTINIVGIFGLVEIAFGSFFGIGFSEVAYASRSAGNPIYGEMLFRDRLNYRSKQLMTGFNLIISGAILLLFSVMMSNI